MKSPLKSKTIRTTATLFTASATSLALFYSGAIVLDSAALGAAWSTIISSAVMVFLRFATTEQISTKKVDDQQE